MDPELEIRREFIRERIYQKLVQQREPLTAEMQTKLKDIAWRLEVALYKSSASREEYLNIDTLDNRLYTLIKRLPASTHSQQLLHNASSSISTIIPTLGISPNGNTNLTVTSSLDSSMNATSGSINAADGVMSNEYQEAPSHVIGSGNFQSTVKSEPSYSGSGSSGVEPTMVSHQSQLHRKRQIDGQNNHIIPSFGGQVGAKRSTLQQNLPSYGISNGDLNGVSGLIGNDMQLSGSAVSDRYLTTSQIGDDYSMNLVDLSGPKSNSSLTSSQPIQVAKQTKELEQARDTARIAEQGKQEAELKAAELERKVAELEDKLAKKDDEVASTRI
ncbi:histone acetyltransferase [Ranunculus cassubicifolius]